MKLKLIPLLALVFLWFACNSSDDTPDPPEEPVNEYVGTWILVELIASEPIDNNDDGASSTNLIDELPCLGNTLVFNEDFTFSRSSTNLDIQFIPEDESYLFSCGEVDETLGTYTIESDRIRLSRGTPLFFEGDQLVQNPGNPIPEFLRAVWRRE